MSSQLFHISVDPVGGANERTVVSMCSPGSEQPTASCSLRIQRIGGPTEVVGDTPGAASDRLPTVYMSAIAFARFEPNQPTAEIRFLPAGAATSRQLAGGPAGAGSAGPTGTALREDQLAYAWTRRLADGRTRHSLHLQHIDGRPRTLASVDARDGRLLGPVWQGSRLIYAIRSSRTSRLFRFDVASGRTATRTGPRDLASFTVSGSTLYYQTATARQLRSGFCFERGGCRLFAQTPLSFATPARRPR